MKIEKKWKNIMKKKSTETLKELVSNKGLKNFILLKFLTKVFNSTDWSYLFLDQISVNILIIWLMFRD